MPDERRLQTAVQASSPKGLTAARSALRLPEQVLRAALTPRTLFTNMFPVALPAGNLGLVQQAPVTKARKEALSDRLKPSFYETAETLFAYGVGLDEFDDARFTRGIVTAETEVGFTRWLIRLGLAEYFRAAGYPVRMPKHQLAVLDTTTVIKTDGRGILEIRPEFLLQVFSTEDTTGAVRFAVAIEPTWTTVPRFVLGNELVNHERLLKGLRLVAAGPSCLPGCPLSERDGETIGVFDAFGKAGSVFDCNCAGDSFKPIPVVVVDRKRVTGGRDAKTDRFEERRLVLPGQHLRLAQGQRGVLRLFHERVDIERSGRTWLGDLSPSGIRANALQQRYARMQEFLATAAQSTDGSLSFSLPTGAAAELLRIPLLVEEIQHV